MAVLVHSIFLETPLKEVATANYKINTEEPIQMIILLGTSLGRNTNLAMPRFRKHCLAIYILTPP